MVKEDTRSKRQAIIESARKMFATKGYEDTTIAEIAEDAGIAVGTVYLYFDNKRDIYTDVSLNWAALLAAAFEDPAIAALPFEQVPRAMVEATFRICRQDSEMMSLFQVDIQSQEEIKKHKAADGLITGVVDNFFRQAIAQGQLAPFDTETYAKIMFGMVHSVLFECFCVEGGENEALFRERTIEIIERLLFGPSLSAGENRENV
ncbi:MAG TPA: TetR/AcrR family transcriptional regulator [Ktedonobacteraceae bacterium]|nr:TetR/AcrR family transcriptional regulator [Ktedonobacteraceae bacterium]